jgi:crotonobetainyl-CoA:carnitine CoA-transferase CaiB-like acyl-CoA transferase
MSGPLAGLRIFDLTRILAGPTATQVLGDLGADVIKIERPGQGDDTRKWGPPYVKDGQGRDTSESAYFLAANRNKRSITIDLEQPAGQTLARRLVAKSDVLFENFKVGNLAKYGLAYDQLKGEFPGLIYCSLTGFGQTGPYAPRAGYDLAIQAMGGLMSITGERDGPPVKVGVGIADLVTGLYCVTGILAALHHRHATGLGQHIERALQQFGARAFQEHVAADPRLILQEAMAAAEPGRHALERFKLLPNSVRRRVDENAALDMGLVGQHETKRDGEDGEHGKAGQDFSEHGAGLPLLSRAPA